VEASVSDTVLSSTQEREQNKHPGFEAGRHFNWRVLMSSLAKEAPHQTDKTKIC